MKINFRSREESRRILASFSQECLESFISVAESAGRDVRGGLRSSQKWVEYEKTIIGICPLGWIANISGNAIEIRYGGRNEGEGTFFTPHIFIEFDYVEEVRCSKEVIDWYPTNLNSLGEPIKFVQKMFLAIRDLLQAAA